MLSPAIDLDLSSFIEPSPDTSSPDNCGLLSSSTKSLDMDSGVLADSCHASATNVATAIESPRSFDWNNWEDWMLWDENNDATELHVPQTANSPMSSIKPSVASTSDGREVSSCRKSIDIKPFLGLTGASVDATGPFPLEDMPFEFGSNETMSAFDNYLQSPAALVQPSTGGLPDSDFLPLEQFQFPKADPCLNLPLEQSHLQDLLPQNYSSPEQSLSSASHSCRSASFSSPERSQVPCSKKRKSSADDEDGDLAPTKSKRVPGKRSAHNEIEKRYRTNLNEKIAALRDSIPSLQQVRKYPRRNKNDEDDGDDDDDSLDSGSRQVHKINKGVVLSKATEYIRQLEKRNKKLNDEMAVMKIRLNVFKTLATGRPIGLSNGIIRDSEGARRVHANETQSAYQANAHAADPAHSLGDNTRSVNRQGSGGGGYMSKLMVGSLAGLMIMQGFNEKEQAGDAPSGRGLFGLPTQYMGGMRHIGQSNVAGSMPILESLRLLLKVVLLFGAIIYVISPSFFDAKSEEKAKPIPDFTLTAGTSPVSPVDVRRSAWLTAVQTVWVPRKSFLLQISALVLKSLKLFLRSTIGWNRYAMLFGATKEQEAARIKAWDTALDAQLTGGDAEISMSRLALTMIASGTLPETPYRLMLKALHIHVLLWGVANNKLGGWYLCRSLAAKLARYQWEKARKLQEQTNISLVSNEASGSDTLPEYLAKFLELDSDVVMADVVVQRAYSLAWVKPTAQKDFGYVDGIDSITDDSAIRSPLDYLAAWYSCLVLHEVLTESLQARAGTTDVNVAIRNNLELALKIAPPASLVQSRGLVARAMLFKEGRGANIAVALQALPMLSSQSGNRTPTNVESISPTFSASPSPPDLALTLQCAIVAAFLERKRYHTAAFALSKQLQFSRDALGLLGFTATYNFLDMAFQDKNAANETREVLENAAGTLKVWMSGKLGKNSGIGEKAKVNITVLCMNVLSWLAGMRGDWSDDQGYVTMSDGTGRE